MSFLWKMGVYLLSLFIDGSKLPYHLDRVHDWNQGKEIFPIHVEISPSSGCNQRCTLCCVNHLGHKAGSLSREVLMGLLDDFVEHGVKSYLLAGEGEPLTNKHVIEFIRKAHDRGISGAINSNGVLLKEAWAEEILPCLEWARFTFLSPDPDNYARVHVTSKEDFYRARENLEKAVAIKRRHNLPVTLGIQQILINENWHEVYENAKMSKEIGVDYFTVKRFSKHPDNTYDVPEDLYKQSMDQFEQCEALNTDHFQALVRWNQFATQCVRTYEHCVGLPFITQILADGTVSPCCQFFGDKSRGLGNLNEDSFATIWTSQRKREIIGQIEQHQDVSQCMSYCRHHSTNMFLWKYKRPPGHINFI